ncbi:hypothetical protein [Frankia sp. AvcI1]|uniref:hypothetical protein n=1 Tax=Frankia sp. AvcI1 TaxID=573496 RepID=UPI0006EBF444|nr:hypothetical protein [Frankia sp. AvcI1]
MIANADRAALAGESEAQIAARIAEAARRADARRAAELKKRTARDAGLVRRHARKINRLERTPPMTTATPTAADPPTARTLIDTGACAAGCMLAVSPPRTCRCGCSGQHHGALGPTPVPTLDPARAAA